MPAIGGGYGDGPVTTVPSRRRRPAPPPVVPNPDEQGAVPAAAFTAAVAGDTHALDYVPGSTAYAQRTVAPLVNIGSPSLTPTLPPSLVHLVPPSFRPYLPTVIQAATKYGVPPSVLLAQIQQESSFGTDPGTFTGSGSGPGGGAKGVTQFEDSTATMLDPRGKPYIPGGAATTSSSRPADIRAQIMGQADYMAALQKEHGGDLTAALTAYSGGYPTSQYAGPITQAAKQYAAADKVAAAPGGYRTPAPPYAYPFSNGISIGRTDMGIDPSGPGTIATIGKARYLGTGGSGWPTEGGTGTGPVYKLLKGPLAGQNVYTYEGITPVAGLQRGDILKRGTPIAQSTGSSFETGFAQGRSAGFQPTAASHYSEGDVTPEGQAFAKLIGRLQGRPGQVGGNALPPAVLGQGSAPVGQVMAGTGAPLSTAQSAVTAARKQKAPQFSLVNLAPPNAAGAPFPTALASLFGGNLPAPPGGSSGGSPMSTSDLAAMLLSGSAGTTPLSTLRSSRRRRSS